jgi:Zn-dependent protease with chaperone function
MERESLLTLLAILLGGAALQVIAAWLSALSRRRARSELEGAAWLRLWRPLVPALTVVAGLCGWALSEPDPVPDRVGPLVFVVCAPFALIGIRALVRAVWALLVSPDNLGIATIGLFRPRIIVDPDLARLLDERALQAALAHERAHVRHLDPLRIWIAQFVTDLQWPWASAQRRFEAWLTALEQARDDEARAEGIEGSDLAAALVASIRFHRGMASGICAPLTGDRSALEARIDRLLQPLQTTPRDSMGTYVQLALFVTLALLAALGLGHIYGKWLVGALLALS